MIFTTYKLLSALFWPFVLLLQNMQSLCAVLGYSIEFTGEVGLSKNQALILTRPSQESF